jgi:outer membrane protein OmpA-like peptidoglycan-associated protein
MFSSAGRNGFPTSSEEPGEFQAFPQPRFTPQPPPVNPVQHPIRFTISKFPRYTHSAAALPLAERKKLFQIARIILESHQSQKRPIRRVLLVGHADFDTPRRPDFEQRVSLRRALSVEAALIQAVEFLSSPDRSQPPPRPLYSRRIHWKERGFGATEPIVPAPRTEAERALNRRVEITLNPSSPVTARRRTLLVGQGQPSPSPVTKKLEDAIDRFRKCVVRDKCCGFDEQSTWKYKDLHDGNSPPDTIGPQNCFCAVTEAACRLSKGSIPQPKLPPSFFGDFVGSKDLRAPYSKQMSCCTHRDDFRQQCAASKTYNARCTHCFTDPAPRLVIKYRQQALDQAVSTLKTAIDAGFLVRAGVLSGICDDKPDLGCVAAIKKSNPSALGAVWKLCPEHYILIIARDENTFLFYDSSHASVLVRGEFTFGLLFYDSSDVRLSTAKSSSNLNVGSWGFHTNLGFTDPAPPTKDPQDQKRFQVLNLAVTGHWNCAGNETVTHQDRCWKFSASCKKPKGGGCGCL